jgi:hypothetical protein
VATRNKWVGCLLKKVQQGVFSPAWGTGNVPPHTLVPNLSFYAKINPY